MNSNLESLEEALGYTFKDRALLRRAITHSSSINECGGESGGDEAFADNERLEFLGDSILGWVVSEWLFARFAGFREGEMSLVKNHVVSARHLLEAAIRVRLGDYLHLGCGEESTGGRNKQRLLANAFEAIIAAVYLDGGAAAARDLVFREIIPSEAEAKSIATAGPPHDYRAELDRLARERGMPRPVYTPVGEAGPPHARVFSVLAKIGKDMAVTAEGRSRKAAAHNAARRLCETLRGRTDD